MLGLSGLIRRDLKLKNELNEKFDYEDPTLNKRYNQMWLADHGINPVVVYVTPFNANSIIPAYAAGNREWIPCGLLDANKPKNLEIITKINQTKIDTSSSQSFRMHIGIDTATTDLYVLERRANYIIARRAGSNAATYTETSYSSTGDLYLKLSFENGIISFQYSSNGKTYTTLHTRSESARPRKASMINAYNSVTVAGKDIKVKADGKYLFNFE